MLAYIIHYKDQTRDKAAAECWNISKCELDSVVNRCVPLKKQGNRFKKKHLSKEAFRKIRYKCIII